MSRLDRHVGTVRNKLALNRFLQAASAVLVITLALYVLTLLAERFSLLVMPPMKWLLLGGIGGAALFGLVWALIYRPSQRQAAVLIDDKLQLHEKFSTALFMRANPDPFAQAAVVDAECAAAAVQPAMHFPVRAPAANLCWATALLAVAVLVALVMPQFDPFAVQEHAKKAALQAQKVTEAREQVEKAIAEVNALPKSATQTDEIQQIKKDLENLNDPKAIASDPAKAERVARKALRDAQASAANGAEEAKRVALDNGVFKANSIQATDEQGAVPEAQNQIVEGKFAEAADKLDELADDFANKSQEEQQKTQQQMQNLANQLQASANNPNVQQQMQQQLQQAGATQQQAQQMSNLMQQAAQGNQQAQQQLQQMAQQIGQQMAKGGQPTAAQQQQIAAGMQAAQQMANAQANNGNMAQAAQAMAQAMGQAKAAAQQAGQPGQSPQQAAQNAAAMQQAQASLKQAAGAMAAAAQAQQMQQAQGGGQPGQGQQAGGQQGAGANGAGAQQAGQGPGQAGQGQGAQLAQGAGNQAGNGQGQFTQGNPQQGQGQGGQGGVGGVGGHVGKELVPFATKMELSPSQENDNGEVVASFLIKDNKPDKGQSTATLQNVAASAEKDLTDEVDNDRVSRPEADAARKYFNTMKEEDK